MKAVNQVGSMFLRVVLRRMKELGVSQTELAKRMNASRPYVVKVLANVPEKRVRVSEGTRIAARFARRARKGAREVNITLGSAARFAHALQMDFVPTLTPIENVKPEPEMLAV